MVLFASGFLFVQMVIIKQNITFLLCVVLITFTSELTFAQYAPPAGQPNSTAINADSNVFIDWASSCIIERGWVDISMHEYGLVSYGSDTNGVGKADNTVVSLGDGGTATLSFNTPIADGDGYDFAVFENSFIDDFLELAFVEVSSNGSDYYRFKAVSLTQQDTQVATFGLIDAKKIHNLAGKYRVLEGTPFDLHELINTPNLDVSNIVSVRVVDVVGSIIGEYATYDCENNIINEPWPTPFPSGGFDIDAIGVINNRNNTSVKEINGTDNIIIFPNPAKESFNIALHENVDKLMIFDIHGNLAAQFIYPDNKHFNIEFLLGGFYIVKIFSHDKLITDRLIVE